MLGVPIRSGEFNTNGSSDHDVGHFCKICIDLLSGPTKVYDVRSEKVRREKRQLARRKRVLQKKVQNAEADRPRKRFCKHDLQ